MSKNWGVFLTMKVLENTPAVLSLGKVCDENAILMNGSMVKNHISLKTGGSQACQRARPPDLIRQPQGHFQDRRVIVPHLLQARLRHQR